MTALKKGTVTIKAIPVKDGSIAMQTVKVKGKAVVTSTPISSEPVPVDPVLLTDTSFGGSYTDLEVESDSVQNFMQSIVTEPAAFPDISFIECNSINDFNYSVFQKVVVSGGIKPFSFSTFSVFGFSSCIRRS